MEHDDYDVFMETLDEMAEEDKRPYEWGQQVTTIGNISLRNRQLTEVKLDETTISNCCFHDCTFIGVVFDKSLIRWSIFSRCRFYACSFVGVRTHEVTEMDSAYVNCNGQLQRPGVEEDN